MPNRILRDWTDSVRMEGLSVEAERFFTRLIMKADDFGRFHGDERLLKAALYPLLPDMCLSQVRQLRDECAAAGILLTYKDSRNRIYIEINDFRQRSRSKTSKWPAPDGQVTVLRPTCAHGDGDGDGDGDVDVPPIAPQGGHGKPSEKKKKVRSSLHPLHCRIIRCVTPQSACGRRDDSEMRAWRKSAGAVTEAEVALVEWFYGQPKSAECDGTWRRKTGVTALLNQWTEQVDLAREQKSGRLPGRAKDPNSVAYLEQQYGGQK